MGSAKRLAKEAAAGRPQWDERSMSPDITPNLARFLISRPKVVIKDELTRGEYENFVNELTSYLQHLGEFR